MNKFSKLKKSFSKRSKLQKILIIVVTLIVIAGLLFAIIRPHLGSDRKVIYDGEKEQTQDIKEGLINIPKDAKSATCEKFTTEKIEKVIGQKTDGARVSIPNTNTTEGVVSACAYDVTNKKKSPISSIIITRREFKDPQAAKRSFDILTRISDKNRKSIDDNSYYNQKTGQIVTLRDNNLTVIAISLTSAKSIDKKIYEELSQL